jgi:hypothetical protein
VQNIVGAGGLAHWLAVVVAMADRLALLVFGQFRFAAELVRRPRARMPRSIAASGSSGRDSAAVISMPSVSGTGGSGLYKPIICRWKKFVGLEKRVFGG